MSPDDTKNQMVRELAEAREKLALAEQALDACERNLRVIADNTYDWEYWRAPDGKYLWVSPSCRSITGYSPEEFTGELAEARILHMVHPDDRHLWEEHLLEVDGEHPGHRELDLRIVTRAGETAWISHTCQPIFDEDGRYLGRRGCNRDITARKLAEDAIKASLAEKDVLLREIHHRVKNNLQIILSLLNLQESGIGNPDAIRILAESRARVMSMALIHDQLYRSRNLGSIDIGAYLDELLPRLISAFKGKRDIALKLDVPPISLSLEQAIPFGLIVNELATNALKHAFPEGTRGEIAVSMGLENDVVTLCVEDDGQGFSEHFDVETAASLGLKIVHLLAGQMRGMLCLESAVGASFRLQFPARKPGRAPGLDVPDNL